MRVLQINAVYEKFSTGRTTKELHETLSNQGVESYVATPQLFGLKNNAYKIGNWVDWKSHALNSRITGLQGYSSKIITKKLLLYIDSINPDIIHLRNLHSNYINLPMLLQHISKRNIATVITLHDSWFYTGGCTYYNIYECDKWKRNCGNCPAVKNKTSTWFFDRSDKMLNDKKEGFDAIEKLAIVGVSNWVTNDVKESILNKSTIIKCIYNWIDLNLFSLQETIDLRSKMNLNNKCIILGVAMDWNCKQKGIDIFVELSKKLSDDYQIILVGQKPIVDKICKIKFLGTVADIKKLAQLYAMADIFVNPTIQETFGKTTAEAMACGTPVIAYNGTATPEIIGIDEKCGYLVDENKVELYEKKIYEIKEMGVHTFGKFSRTRAEKMFSRNVNIEKYIELYHQLLHN